MSDQLTKFEIVRMIGVRATQLSQGSPPTVDIGDLTDCIDIAKKELKAGTIPLIIIRTFPNGKKEEIKIKKCKKVV